MNSKLTQKGVAIVEFTILLPLFLLLLLSIMEFGRAFYTYAELEKMSRDSARYLFSEVTKGSSIANLTEESTNKAKNLAVCGKVITCTSPLIKSLDVSHVNITPDGNSIKVEIQYPYQPVLSAIPSFFSNNEINLNLILTSSYSVRVQ